MVTLLINIMILKIRYRVGLSNPTYKQIVEVNTDNYSVLDNIPDISKFSYINKNASQMEPITQGYSSLLDELMSQPTEEPPFSGGTFYSIIGE